MLLKDYQRQTLDAVQAWLQALATARAKGEKLREIDPEMEAGYDFPAQAWTKAGGPRSYVPRKTGAGAPLPFVCLKIPTGGGKTLLATKVVDLVHTHYRRRQTGLVLWIVPTTQIYQQTITALKDRGHPYRQALDLASAGRTLILEKTSGFSPADVQEQLCVLMLMLPSANRLTKETLRMFKDSGGYDALFPARRRSRRPCRPAEAGAESRYLREGKAASSAGRSRPRSATPCACSIRSSSSTKATRPTAPARAPRWRVLTRASWSNCRPRRPRRATCSWRFPDKTCSRRA
jgi:hypothetical protein